jgi:hypothetical protein
VGIEKSYIATERNERHREKLYIGRDVAAWRRYGWRLVHRLGGWRRGRPGGGCVVVGGPVVKQKVSKPNAMNNSYELGAPELVVVR